MKYAPYSPSRVLEFNFCKRKFKYNYIDKIKVEREPNYHFNKGTLVHYFLENHQRIVDGINLVTLIKEAKKYLDDEFYKDKSFLKECIEIYRKFSKSEFGKKLLSYRCLATELEIGLKIEDRKIVPCGFLDEDALFRGKIDAVFVNEENDELFIIDWKTGKDKSTGDFKQNPKQLMYYAAFYFEKFPVKSLTISYIFVEHSTKLSFKMEREKQKEYIKELLLDINNIEKEQEFPRNISKLCDWCDFREYCEKDKD